MPLLSSSAITKSASVPLLLSSACEDTAQEQWHTHLRHPQHVLEAALAGADIGTMPYAVFEKLWKHPMTDLGLERFLADWKKTQK